MATNLENLPPRVFVASSMASAKLAHRLADRLKPDIAAEVWDTLFKPGDNTLDNLLLFSSLYEFGIFVLSADDLTLNSKNVVNLEPRDNAIFELGIFMGAVGRSRAFAVVVDDGDDVKLPTDLAGNTYVKVRFKSPNDTKRAIEVIRKRILELSKTAPLSLLPGTSLAMGYYRNFILPLGRLLRDCKVLQTSASKLDLANRSYAFTVVIPQTLSFVGTDDRDTYIKQKGFESAVLPPLAPGQTDRNYGFFARDTAVDGPVQFFDYPTTLRAANEAIRFVLPERALGERKTEYDILAAREVRTFGRALTLLLDNPETRIYPKPITVTYI